MALERDSDRLGELVHRIDPRAALVRSWSIEGGVSAQTTGLEVALPDGRSERYVVRRHGDADRRANLHIASDEYRLLHALRSAGLPVPTPICVDQSCEILPTPYLVLEYVQGEVLPAGKTSRDRVTQLADCLAQIHSVDYEHAGLSYLPSHGAGFGEAPARLDESLQEGRIRAALEALWPLPRLNQAALLHGDYWPGNVLWAGDRIAAIVDWEDASLGDPLADLGNSRLEVLWAYGSEAMQVLTLRYRACMPALDYANLPYWDLCAALRPANRLGSWGLAPAIERAMRERHAWFVAQAYARLPQAQR